MLSLVCFPFLFTFSSILTLQQSLPYYSSLICHLSVNWGFTLIDSDHEFITTFLRYTGDLFSRLVTLELE
jgi:hypothetical protein